MPSAGPGQVLRLSLKGARVQSDTAGRRCYLDEGTDAAAANTYSCCASRTMSDGFAPEPTTNSNPLIPGAIVMNETEPSGLCLVATSLCHSPKSNTVFWPSWLTVMSPSASL